MSERAIREIVVAGGGIVGWSAAAAFRRQLPGVAVRVVTTRARDALADRVSSTLPSIVGFHQDIGLGESDTVARAGSGYRLGTLFEGWAERDYVHVYGRYGRPFGTASFHHHWVRATRTGSWPTYDAFAPAAALGRAGRFTPPREGAPPLFADHAYGLTLDPSRYREMMRAYALHLGAAEVDGEIEDVTLDDASGFVSALILSGGRRVPGHLFVDCTGPAARVRGALDDAWESWHRWLPCDRVLLGDSPPQLEPTVLDQVSALAAGWRWITAAPSRTSFGMAYSSAHLSDDKAGRAFRNAAASEPDGVPVRFTPGSRPEPWLRNCVAIGEAAIQSDPLEWTNLHLAHSAIDRIVSMLPDRECSAIELAEYNRQSAREGERVRDFLALHFRLTERDDPMWRDVRSVEPPPGLAHTLALFGERGRLPFYEEETFSRDSWAAVMLCQGLLPRRVDPLIEASPADASARAMTALKDEIEARTSTMPTHRDYLQQVSQRAGVRGR